MSALKPIQVKERLWWVGAGSSASKLYCNPFLYVCGERGVLFDPGSVLDAQAVIAQVETIMPVAQLEAIVASHQDPDLCAAIPIFEQHGFSGEICCHERAAMIISYYGISSNFYLVNQNQYRKALSDGTVLQFLYAPYLHFPGAIMTYLSPCKALVSGDVFGAITSEWSLYAQVDYIEAMKTFHESYMPSHDILGPVMNQLMLYDIEIICPQHGSVIDKDIRTYIEVLRDLPCGRFMAPLRKNLMEANGILDLCSTVLKRYLAVYGQKAVREVFAKSDFTIDYAGKRVTAAKMEDESVWDAFFERVLERKGSGWLTMVGPLIESLSKQHSIAIPTALASLVYDLQKKQDLMVQRYQELENQKLELEATLQNIQETLARCPITKLYNQNFYELFVTNEMKRFAENHQPFALLLLSIDNLADINLDFGSAEGDNTMRTLAYMVTVSLGELEQAFRLEGGVFAIYSLDLSRKAAIERANALRNQVAESESFIVPVTISGGLFHSDELTDINAPDIDQIRQVVVQTARFRLRLAKKRGRSSLVHDSSQTTGTKAAFSVLVIDEPGLQRDLIQRALERERYRVTVVSDGLAGRRAIEENPPDVIVSELMVPKIGAFTLRKELLATPTKKRIPFVLMSANKNEDTVKRAAGLSIFHFLARPVMMAELLGIVGHYAASLQEG